MVHATFALESVLRPCNCDQNRFFLKRRMDGFERERVTLSFADKAREKWLFMFGQKIAPAFR